MPAKTARENLLPWLCWALLSARLLVRVGRLAVDLPFWDQWDFQTPLFSGANLWTVFSWQHGPHRQGLGNLLLIPLHAATGWNVRAEAYAAAGIYILATALALWLLRILFQRLTAWSALVPLLLLSGLLADGASGAPNLAHGPLPFLLAIVLALALCIRADGPRLLLVCAIQFLSLFTGFAFFIGLLIPLILLLGLLRAWPSVRARSFHFAALASCATSLALFFHGYQRGGAPECSAGSPAIDQLEFAALLLTRPFGISGVAGWRAPFVLAAALSIAVAAAWAIWKTLRTFASEAISRSASLFLAFAVLFAFASASARACLEVTAAAAPRYVPYALLGFFGIYIIIYAWPASARRSAFLAMMLLACLAKEALASLRPVRDTLEESAGKRRWRSCYIARQDIDACDRETGFRVHPRPAETRLAEKLEFLRQHQLGLFRQ